MDPSFYESSLRRRILGIIAATAPLAALTACGGNTTDNTDGGDGACQSMCCNMPPPQQYTVSYVPCPAIVFDASDDGEASVPDDAGADASDDASDGGPAPICYASCMDACMAQRPYNSPPYGGATQCMSEDVNDASGERVAHCEILQLCGRRFEGLVEAACGDAGAIGDVLARAAWLEAASIHAFRRLARELRAHGAPEELVRAAKRSARDEARHARAMARLARRHGAVVPRVERRDESARDLEAIARENALEACVGETYGALLAAWQAEHARDEGVRAAMREIAPDELRHAALCWAIAEWADTRLSSEARERVRRAREEAARDILQNAHIEPSARIAELLGAPRAEDAKRLAGAMNAQLWS